MKTYLLYSFMVMVVCLLGFATIMILPMPKSEYTLKKQIHIGRIAIIIYTVVGVPAIVLGVPYLLLKLFY